MELTGKKVNFDLRGKKYCGTVIRERGHDYVIVDDYRLELDSLLKSIREDSRLDALAKNTIDTLKGDPTRELDTESLSNNASALKNIQDAVKVSALASADQEIKNQANDDKTVEEATKKAMAATKVEQDKEKGTVPDTKAAEDAVKQFLKDGVIDEYAAAKKRASRVSDSDFASFVKLRENITEELEIARSTMGSLVDRLYAELDSGERSPEEGFEEMITDDVPEDVALAIIENATGIKLFEAFVREDADYLDSDGEVLDEEPARGEGDNDSLGMPEEKKLDAIALATELLFRGQPEEDVAEFIELEYETSRDEAASVVNLAKQGSKDAADVNEEEVTDTIEKMNEQDKLADVMFSSGEEVTDEWENRFEKAIDEFEVSDVPYSSEDLYDYLYQKFEVPEEEAAECLKLASFDVPQAVVILCEHCRKKSSPSQALS
jgi:hypothetical protein